MVRIIRDKETSRLPERVLPERSTILLPLFSIVLAEQPQAIQDLLQEYQVALSDAPTDQERTSKLLSAVAACDHRFNRDLARIIFNCAQEQQYDHFDIKGMFSKTGEAGVDEAGSSSGGNGGGLIAGIANAVGGIGGAIGQGIKGKQAKDQATSTTLQGIYNYRTQLAATEKSKGKNKMLLLVSLMVLVVCVIGGIAYMKKNQAKQTS